MATKRRSGKKTAKRKGSRSAKTTKPLTTVPGRRRHRPDGKGPNDILYGDKVYPKKR